MVSSPVLASPDTQKPRKSKITRLKLRLESPLRFVPGVLPRTSRLPFPGANENIRRKFPSDCVRDFGPCIRPEGIHPLPGLPGDLHPVGEMHAGTSIYSYTNQKYQSINFEQVSVSPGVQFRLPSPGADTMDAGTAYNVSSEAKLV